MAKPTIQELRAIVAKRQRAVTNKISRTRRVNGAEIAGTEYDPRKQRDDIARMNRRQLQSTLNQYNKFTSRATQFYGDAERRPITRQQWQRYKNAEAQFNQASDRRFAPFKNTDVPLRNMTASAYRAATQSEFPGMADAAVNDPYGKFNRQPSNIASVKRLDKLVADMRKRATAKDYQERIQSAREIANTMLERLGNDHMARDIEKLSAKQFEWLWNVSPFAKSASLRYHSEAPDDDNSPKSWVAQAADDQEDDMKVFVNAARKIK